VLLVQLSCGGEEVHGGRVRVSRRLVMHNDFVVVGPAEDPAKLKGLKSAGEAFKKMAAASGAVISRGDNSGPMLRKRMSGRLQA